MGVVGRGVTLNIHTSITKCWIPLQQQKEVFFNLNILNVTIRNFGHTPTHQREARWSIRPLSGMRGESSTLPLRELSYVTVLMSLISLLFLVLSLLGSHGTIRAQYTECSLTQNHKTVLKTLRLLIVGLPLHRELMLQEKGHRNLGVKR